MYSKINNYYRIIETYVCPDTHFFYPNHKNSDSNGCVKNNINNTISTTTPYICSCDCPYCPQKNPTIFKYVKHTCNCLFCKPKYYKSTNLNCCGR